MGKRHHLLIILITGLFLFSCQRQPTPVIPTPGLPADIPELFSASTPGPSKVSGEFILTNTSAPGMEVGIENMNILLEYRLSVEDPWKKIEVNCFFDPPPPVVLKDEIPVQYECQYEKRLPADAEQRVTAEVEIYGSNEVFRLLVNPP